MKFPQFLARRIGARITVTVGPDKFRFEGPGLGNRPPPDVAVALRIGGDLRVAAMGDEALAAKAPGVLIQPLQTPPRSDAAWVEEGFLVQYCRYHLLLVGSESWLHFLLDVGPVVTVREAGSLHAVFRGRETEILDRVLRAAGASTVQFAPDYTFSGTRSGRITNRST